MDTSSAEVSQDAEERNAIAGKHVLLIGRDSAELDGLQRALSDQDRTVTRIEAGDVRPASPHEGGFDVCVVDLDGIESSADVLLPDLRAGYPFLPVLALSSRAPGDIPEPVRREIFLTVRKPITDPHLLPELLEVALKQQQLTAQNEVYQHEVRRLNRYLRRAIDQKAAEVSIIKDRLATMFRIIPTVLASPTVEQKLWVTAEALTGPNFFESCTIYLEDAGGGILVSRAGNPAELDQNAAEAYSALRIALTGAADARTWTPLSHEDGLETTRLLVPVKNDSGAVVGVAELSAGSREVRLDQDLYAVIELFLMQTCLSIGQFRLERHVERREATYRSLIENVSDIIFSLDCNGVFTFVNRQIKDLLDLEWKEVLGTHFMSIVHADDLDKVRTGFARILSGESMARDIVLVRPDGESVIVFVAANPIRERDRITGLLGVARDVTEKRRLERQMRESERRYRGVLENAYDAIVLIDPETYQIVEANPQASHLTGYSPEELVGKSVIELRTPDFADVVRDRIRMVMESGSRQFDDAPLVRKDGTVIDVGAAASVLELDGKRYYQAILRDVTVQKKTTESLNRRLLELQILTEVSDALQSIVDLQSVMGIVLAGITAGQGLGFNRAFIFSYDHDNKELRGEAGVGPKSAEEAGKIWAELEAKDLTLSEVLQEKMRAFPHSSDAMVKVARQFTVPLDNENCALTRAIRDREVVHVNRDNVDPHLPESFAAAYPVREFAFVPLVTREEVVGAVLVDNFFSRRPIGEEDLNRLRLVANSAASAIERGRLLANIERKLHELTLANQELKISRDKLVKTERLSAIGEVAATVAHEIRNPLTAIGGFARSALNSMEESDKNRTKLSVIVEETQRLENILDSLLEFSRPASPKFTELDINSLILQTIFFMDSEIDHDLLEVVYDLESDLPKTWADADQVRQVLLNIIRNAMQEMKDGGLLTISSQSDDSEIIIKIKDTGPGVPDEIREKVFDAFFTTKSTGSGLGLAICSQLIRNHSGRLEIESEQEQGACVTISLPISQKDS